jgi:hypothetical protein
MPCQIFCECHRLVVLLVVSTINQSYAMLLHDLTKLLGSFMIRVQLEMRLASIPPLFLEQDRQQQRRIDDAPQRMQLSAFQIEPIAAFQDDFRCG